MIFWTDAAIWSKLTLGLLATITLEAVPFALMYYSKHFCHFFKYILEVVFREGVQHLLQFCLCQLSCVKMAAIQF
jgi:hypothetical protein